MDQTPAVSDADDKVLRRQTDRRQLQQIITGLTEGVILVEPDQSIVWANQAALDMHGVEDVKELGVNASEYRERFRLRYRNNHAVQPGSYPIDRVIAGEGFSDVIVEVYPAHDEEQYWVHRVRSLVLTNSADEPDCLVLILHDATDWASAEQRFEKTFNANPAPAVICRLSDQRYIKVNQGFVEMTGYAREQVIGRSVYEIDAFESAERRELAIERLGEGATIPQMEALLRLPQGGSKCVVVAGQPIDIGEEACMLFTFMDLEPRKKAENALRQSEERFEKSFRMTPVPTVLLSAEDFTVLDLNAAFTATTGFSQEEALGRTIDEMALWHADARARIAASLAASGSLRNVEFQLQNKDGESLACLVSAEVVSIHGKECLLMAFLDITERKRTEMELVVAIETVMQDASWFSRTLIEKLANVRRSSMPDGGGAQLADLTSRERDVFDLLCRGLADKEIAKELALAPNTVRNHVSTIYAKLDVHSRGEAIVWARERGFFGLPAADTPRRKKAAGN
ncbi:helix-turn-helix transcriptional regulator [Collimonas sp.]|jgi:PAS domain S-box-containing protein|uniref:helix-turn-helix transcriptional regulator n=1 Tax=Collimonas sp. TaxID=1963772 RepID=UPI002BFB920E|nr:helix-turn-helix transcriptional regulator [Collimonas sp.]HWX00692.1 helix-turn-helix transcriptional regulator [Collimonas sp.]